MRGDGSRLTSSGLSLCGVFMVWGGKRQERSDRGRGEDHGQGVGKKTNKQQHDLSVHVTGWCALVSGSASAGFFTGTGRMLGSGYGNTDYLEIFNYIF